jgi:hypothetical protein
VKGRGKERATLREENREMHQLAQAERNTDTELTGSLPQTEKTRQMRSSQDLSQEWDSARVVVILP